MNPADTDWACVLASVPDTQEVAGVDFRILGPLEVTGRDGTVDLRGRSAGASSPSCSCTRASG